MNRRDLLKSSATLAAAVVGCIPQEKNTVCSLTTRLADDCHVEVAITDADGWIVIDELWNQHRLAERLPEPKFVPGWSCWTYQKPLSEDQIKLLLNESC